MYNHVKLVLLHWLALRQAYPEHAAATTATATAGASSAGAAGAGPASYAQQNGNGAAGGGGRRWAAQAADTQHPRAKDLLINRLKGSVNLDALTAQCRDAKLAMGPAELAVAFNQLARISEPQHMTARDWAATKVRGWGECAWG